MCCHRESKLQHPDFARGHPPHYYPGRDVPHFADQTECDILTAIWPWVKVEEAVKVKVLAAL